MNQSRLMWSLGAGIGLMLTVGGVLAHTALTHHRLVVTVTDSNGPLAGVWVALNDGDVIVTDASGRVEIRRRRYELDNAQLTVSDTSLNQIHLAQTLPAAVSWRPWHKRSHMKVVLQQFDPTSKVPLQLQDISGSDTALDLPLGGAVHQGDVQGVGASGNASMPGRAFREEDLDSPPGDTELNVGLRPGPVLTDASQAGSPGEFVFLARPDSEAICRWVGFSHSFCAISAQEVQIPQLMTEQSQDASRMQSGTQRPAASVRQESSRPLAALPADKGAQSQASEDTKPTGDSTTAKTTRSALTLNIISAGRGLAGAGVFMSRIKDNRVREMGTTAADGTLEFKVPREFLGETVTVFHSCCSPKTFPLNLGVKDTASVLRFEMQPGSGWGVLVQREAYGWPRRVEHSDLLSPDGKLAVMGSDGFAIYNNSKTPERLLRKVNVRAARPFEFLISPQDTLSSASAPLTFFVSHEQTYLPALAVIERSDGKAFQGILKSAELRRWRRDFIARMMQLRSVRTVVSSEAESRIAASGESLPDVVSRGWSNTHLAGEWDFLLSINYDETQNGVKISAIDQLGREFFEKKTRLLAGESEFPVESVARKTYDSFVESIPFEASVIQQVGHTVVLSFPDAKQFGLKPNMPLAIYQESDEQGQHHVEQRLTDLAALARVTAIDDKNVVRAKITHWNVRNRKTERLPDVVRAVKIGADDYQRESKRKGLSQVGGTQESSIEPKAL